ncbi:permease-like cell division protein FtsX [Alicyclobacillus macrosporangiidus]|uniref:permease-like cell division protein FtsX n=1 Tax=Alicyclobacillus macrosporangiidus TaxID=392015 RepID=UPI000497F556|nr:permease-like cell division protein FtsX [Alicyclobacillus macrosporangiidus]
MTIRMMGRHLREGFKNLLRNGWMTFASVSAVAITLLILGVTLVIALNAEQMSNYVQGQLEVSAFLKDDVSDAQARQITQQIAAMPGVKSAEYISKEEGFQQLKQELGSQYQDILGGLSQKNTLPAKVVVKADDPRQTLAIGERIAQMPGVEKVNDGKEVVDKLFRFLDLVRNIGLAFVVGLVITAMFLISNTIRITIFSRRREIEIMKLVGATNWFIRWPFLTEGLLIGLIGALIPFVVIVFGYRTLYARFDGSFLALAFPLISADRLAGTLAEVLFGLGLFIGLWGGIVSIRRFLRI